MSNGRSETAYEIEQDVRRTQASLERVIDALEVRLEPRNLIFDVVSALWRSAAQGDAPGRLGHAIVRNPIPVTLVAVAGAWLAADSMRRKRRAPEEAWDELRDPLAVPADEFIVGGAPTEPATTTIYEADSRGSVRAKHDVEVRTSSASPPPPAPEAVVGAEPSQKSAAASAEVFATSDKATSRSVTSDDHSETILVRPDGTPVNEEEVKEQRATAAGKGSTPGEPGTGV